MAKINASIDFDKRLYAQDIRASRAHAAMLAATGILTATDAKKIDKGLAQIQAEIEKGDFAYDIALEDIHMHVESRLKTLIGDAAGRLHTARSRNDQAVTDLRLYVRDQIDIMESALQRLQAALIEKAEAHSDTLLPGFTHLQIAQPVTFGHHLLAYVEMFGRDRGRFADARRRLNECPLGAAALAGTSFPIDRVMTAKALGFDRPTANSLDSVSDRDFVVEFLAAASLTATHLSRLGEEIVLWASPMFGFITLSEAFTTGSSIMPQKRNPDAAELLRGKTGRITGALVALLTTLKGLSLTYSKDLQEDKEPLFDASDALNLCLQAAEGMIRDMQPNVEAMHAAAEKGYSTATDIADWLVQKLNLPFRDAHHITGKIVRLAEEKQCRLIDLPLSAVQKIEPRITASLFDVLTPEASAASRMSLGGTAPKRVKEAVKAARRRFL